MRIFTGRLLVFLVIIVTSLAAFAQRFTPPPAGFDISGSWFIVSHQDLGLGTAQGMLVDYGGIPINEAGRLNALAWTPNRQTSRQEQCMGYVPPFMYVATRYRFWEERDPFNQRLTAVR
jgi:hypothetical protein